MHFETVFDIAEVGYKAWYFPAVGLLFIVLGAVILLVPPNYLRFIIAGPPSRTAGWVLLIGALLWTAVAFVGTFVPYIASRNALRTGAYSLVEGSVTDFVPQKREGKGPQESFTVAGQRFEYSAYTPLPGFNTPHSHGGPIQEGVYVRIAHKANTILRLEIAR